MPNQFSQQTERRIVAFALAHPGAGPDRIASELRREKWGELVVSASRVYRVLRRHGRLEARAIGWSRWGPEQAIGTAMIDTCADGCGTRGTVVLSGGLRLRVKNGWIPVYNDWRSGLRVLTEHWR